MISGTEPQRKASTGVPQAMASIMDKPNGSGQSIGNSSALRLAEEFASSARSSISPMNSTPGRSSSGAIVFAEIGLVDLVDLGGDLERQAERRAIRMARSGRFSGEMRPRNAT